MSDTQEPLRAPLDDLNDEKRISVARATIAQLGSNLLDVERFLRVVLQGTDSDILDKRTLKHIKDAYDALVLAVRSV